MVKFYVLKKTIECCGEIEVIKFHGGMFGNHSKRKQKSECKKTSEKVARHNFRMEAKNLYNLLRLNFNKDDWHIALTYSPEKQITAEEAEKEITNFFKRLRYHCKKSGIVLKYIRNTDIGKTGRIHHHVILPQEIPFALINNLWSNGRVNLNNTLWDNKDYYNLACYLIDPTHKGTLPDTHIKGQKRYKCSNNLIRPKVEYEIIRAERWVSDPRPPKGYYIKEDSLYNSIDEFTGFPYQSYILIPDLKRRI